MKIAFNFNLSRMSESGSLSAMSVAAGNVRDLSHMCAIMLTFGFIYFSFE